MTPPKHVNFRAKKLFGEMGRIVDGSVAYIELNGGGPTELHTHEHNHLFIVTEGEARIQLGDETVTIHKDEMAEGQVTDISTLESEINRLVYPLYSIAFTK